jgi:hypothetical protein
MSKDKIKYHFLYKTTNLINGKYYYGMHSTYKLDDGYLGSGKMLRYSIRKYGKKNFSIEIIEFFDTREKLVNAEINLITEEMIIDDNLCMNLKKGGMGGIISEEHQIRMKEGASKWMTNQWKNEEWVKKLKSDTSNRNKKHYEDGIREKFYFYDWTGKRLLEETKRKIGEKNSINQKGEKNSQFGTCWITKEGENKKIKKELLEDYIKDGWIKGRK